MNMEYLYLDLNLFHHSFMVFTYRSYTYLARIIPILLQANVTLLFVLNFKLQLPIAGI